MFDHFHATFQPSSGASRTGMAVDQREAVRGFDELMSQGGSSFNDGLYFLHDRFTKEQADALVAEAFPELLGRIDCFGRDWLGRQFSLDASRFASGVLSQSRRSRRRSLRRHSRTLAQATSPAFHRQNEPVARRLRVRFLDRRGFGRHAFSSDPIPDDFELPDVVDLSEADAARFLRDRDAGARSVEILGWVDDESDGSPTS